MEGFRARCHETGQIYVCLLLSFDVIYNFLFNMGYLPKAVSVRACTNLYGDNESFVNKAWSSLSPSYYYKLSDELGTVSSVTDLYYNWH